MALNLTPKVVAYIAHEEGLVLQAYQDSVKVWTAFLGVTNASGHEVHPRYLDKPQTLERALDVSIWLLNNRYLPAVKEAFGDHELSEPQLAAALSWQWNTGAILATQWVRDFRNGKPKSSRAFLTSHYLNGGTLTARRNREAALFFDGVWPSPMLCPVYPVTTKHTPDWRRGKQIDLMPMLTQILGVY